MLLIEHALTGDKRKAILRIDQQAMIVLGSVFDWHSNPITGAPTSKRTELQPRYIRS
ncbi:hypothetical protein VSR68_30150 [Paraburkholderia phymatum]|uniref:hypothetical protein n=1 Tax=Paraburkholderia phymatum TaxID=148447 RepID=UPI0031820ED7